jgi:serine/threonine protein kinase
MDGEEEDESSAEGSTPLSHTRSSSGTPSYSSRSGSPAHSDEAEHRLADGLAAAAAAATAGASAAAAVPSAVSAANHSGMMRGQSDGATPASGNCSDSSAPGNASNSADGKTLQRALDDRAAATSLLTTGQFFQLFTRSPSTLEDRRSDVFVHFVPALGSDTPGSLFWQEVSPQRAAQHHVPLPAEARVMDENKRFRLNTIKQMRSGKVAPVLAAHVAAHVPNDCCLCVSSTTGLVLNMAATSLEARDAWMRAVHAVVVQHGMRAKVEQAAHASAHGGAGGANTLQPAHVAPVASSAAMLGVGHLLHPDGRKSPASRGGSPSRRSPVPGRSPGAGGAGGGAGDGGAGGGGGHPHHHGHSQSVDRGAALVLSASAASFSRGTANKTISFSDPTSFFVLQRKIGEGSYGAVYKALDLRDNQPVAVKIISFSGVDSSKLKSEIRLLRQCQSPHILSYKGAFQKAEQVWIVTEYCSGGSLSDMMLVCRHTFSENQIAVIMRQTLQGLAYLHAPGAATSVNPQTGKQMPPKKRIIHRDIKGANVLVTEKGECRLADFGVSGTLDESLGKHRTVIGTPHWMAPECLLSDSYSELVDIWSLGITAYELAVGQPPHAELHSLRAALKIPASAPPTLPHPARFSPDFHAFLRSCLVKDWRQRPSAAELLRHPFILNNRSPNSILLPMVHKMRAAVEGREAAQDAAAAASASGSAAAASAAPSSSAAATVVPASAATVVVAASASPAPGEEEGQPPPSSSEDAAKAVPAPAPSAGAQNRVQP